MIGRQEPERSGELELGDSEEAVLPPRHQPVIPVTVGRQRSNTAVYHVYDRNSVCWAWIEVDPTGAGVLARGGKLTLVTNILRRDNGEQLPGLCLTLWCNRARDLYLIKFIEELESGALAMLADATEIEVELNAARDPSTFFGVTWAQDRVQKKVFVKALPRGADGKKGLLECTGLVEIDDCLIAINGVPIGTATLHEIMATIRAAKPPLSLRFARYPPRPPSFPMSLNSSLKSHAESVGFDTSGSPEDVRTGNADAKAESEAEDVELDDVLNSALVLRLGGRVAAIQQRNAQLLHAVDRIGWAAATKRQGVESVALAAAALTTATAALPRALKTLSAARQDASALCEAMARLDELLAARERAQAARRRTNEKGALQGVRAGGAEASEL